MSSKTKIVVFHLKEVIYTGIFLILGILFIVLLCLMFKPKEKEEVKEVEKEKAPVSEESSLSLYEPGTYKSAITLNGHTVEITLVANADEITELSMGEISDSLHAIYPLLTPTFEALSSQICEKQSLDNLEISEDTSYTSSLLLDAINATVAQARVETKEP